MWAAPPWLYGQSACSAPRGMPGAFTVPVSIEIRMCGPKKERTSPKTDSEARYGARDWLTRRNPGT